MGWGYGRVSRVWKAKCLPDSRDPAGAVPFLSLVASCLAAQESCFWNRRGFSSAGCGGRFLCAVSFVSMGYELDNPNIELLRLRSFTVGKPLSDEDFLSPNAQEKIADLIGVMVPFVTYLNSVVMPDPADDEPSGDHGSADED
ncbi:hypothetical protein VTN96DRAFT_1268 [Rasamsonia emersonii]